MRPALTALALVTVLLIARPIHACLWDSDTLASEARGITDVVHAIIGRFERNPPAYYEIRIKHSADRIAANRFDLGAYDDAAVACDRLRRTDEAIAWIEKKGAALDDLEGRKSTLPGTYDEMRYRYLANLGTFRVHRWARSGADRSRLNEVQAGRDLIARAIALKPSAHFGREVTQLKILDTLLNPPAIGPRGLPPLLDLTDPANQTDAAVRGLTGLIVLGDAWESVDLFNTLAQTLELAGERSSVALMAKLRAVQLIEAGRKSLIPGAPTDPKALKLLVESSTQRQVVGGVHRDEAETVGNIFHALREDAGAWQTSRTAFMTPRLDAGRHPDTDPHFWDGYRELPPPDVDSYLKFPSRRSLVYRALFTTRGQITVATGLLIMSTLVLIWVRDHSRRRRESKVLMTKREDGVWTMREV